MIQSTRLLTQAGSLTLNRDTQNGLITGTELGQAITSISYNSFGDLDGYSAAYNGTTLYSLQYDYDELRRINEKIESVEGVTTTYTYIYD